MTRIAVFGATGRMGQTLIRLIADDAALELVGAATEPGHDAVGSDAGSVAGRQPLGVRRLRTMQSAACSPAPMSR